MQFRGITKLSIDAKGRLAMPKNHRSKLENEDLRELVITADTAQCLIIYPKPTWEEVEEKLNALPNHSDYARMLQRLYIGYATDVEMDRTGRVLISPELRGYAKLDRKAVLIGQGKKLELWDEDTWEVESSKWAQTVKDLDPATMPEELKHIQF